MTPKKYGIPIGINYSVRPKTYLQKYFESLCGAVNDITQAQEYMESHHSFEKLRILKFTKTNPQDGKEDSDELKEQWLSRENTIKTFDDTTEEVVKGDWVYIHYSGGVWLDSGLNLKAHYRTYMRKARAAENRVQRLCQSHGLAPELARQIQVAAVQSVALYGAEL